MAGLSACLPVCLGPGCRGLAGEYLDRLEPLVEKVPLLRPLAAAEVAYFEARHRHNLERAMEQVASASPGKNEPRLRAETAIHLLEGHWAESSTSIEAGINVAKAEWIHSLLLEAEGGAT